MWTHGGGDYHTETPDVHNFTWKEVDFEIVMSTIELAEPENIGITRKQCLYHVYKQSWWGWNFATDWAPASES